jgi:hypothetical protein
LGRSQRANNIILLILLTFVLCFSPYHLNIMQFMLRKMLGQPKCDEMRAFKASLQVGPAKVNVCMSVVRLFVGLFVCLSVGWGDCWWVCLSIKHGRFTFMPEMHPVVCVCVCVSVWLSVSISDCLGNCEFSL